MPQDRATSDRDDPKASYHKTVNSSYYTLLGLHPSASVREIRQTYRELSKLYHPDTTQLPSAIATQKFQQLNEAYATLSNPERRSVYDLKIGYSRVTVVQPLPSLSRPQPRSKSSSAYLDATDRPLSAGEIFALFILGVTFVGCLILAITIGLTRGDAAFQPIQVQEAIIQQNVAQSDSEATIPSPTTSEAAPTQVAPTVLPEEPVHLEASDASVTQPSE